MTKLSASILALHSLSFAACGDVSRAEILDSPGFTTKSDVGLSADATRAANDSREANCPVSPPGQNTQNPAGSAAFLWLTPLTPDPSTNASSIAIDANDDAFLTSVTGGITKVAPDGVVIGHQPHGSLVATNAVGDVVIAGSFKDQLELGAITLTSAGGSDVFVAWLDAEGAVTQATSLGGVADETAQSLAVDAEGRVVVSGPGLGLASLTREGDLGWQKDFFGYVATDADANVLVTGALRGSADFGGGTLTSAGGDDVFVVKLDSAGEHHFSRRFGDAGTHQAGSAIAVDSQGNLLVAGLFDGTLDFGAGPLELDHCPSELWCNRSGFVVRLDADGETAWSLSTGALRALSGVASTSTSWVVSGALPGNASSYRIPLLLGLALDGSELWQRTEVPETGVGSGRAVAVDRCDNLLWSVSVKPTMEQNELGYLAKLRVE